jgi:hypothetical protein
MTGIYLVSGTLYQVCYPPPGYPCFNDSENIHFINDTLFTVNSNSEIVAVDEAQKISSYHMLRTAFTPGTGCICYDTLLNYGDNNFITPPGYGQDMLCFSINGDSVNFNIISVSYTVAHGGYGIDSFIYAASGVRIN